ncbi:MAG: ATP-dependent RNA helicase HrpA [Candidatus Nanopelagicales bacterium]
MTDVTLRDRHRLSRRLGPLERTPAGEKRDRAVAAWQADLETARALLVRRAEGIPTDLHYPPELPVSQRRDDLLAAIRDHQVVVVAGETGSGKTTQLPKICLELGRGVVGTIGHTQPRRLAARSVAERISEELRVPLGTTVGYQVRFTDRASEQTSVKLMTDGILLAEIQRDRRLLAYDTVIIDEAHERSLNIDFLLGYLAQLLPRRPDLKVVVTSATIDPDRFSRHFGGAPVVEVSGRTYPVEVRYRPDEDEDRDPVESVCDATRELVAEGPGDVLVFLSGEREIRDTADALGRLALPQTEVLPLYARLSAAEQHRVFAPHPGRRIVLATNVAETSLTVPGIRYVVDPGTARISRYSNRLKVQRLPIERVSQASANQRKGRCGRVSAGVCVRLYTEEDFESRPEFTDPEILRTNLASVILQMAALDLGDIESFPFLDPPDRRSVADGVALLVELGALEPGSARTRPTLTPLGRRLARLPLDPRWGRMVLAAEEHGSLREVLVVAAALSIQDPRERPLDKQQAADEQHRRFADPTSDFLGYLNLWNYLREQQKALSSNAFRRMCRSEFLHYLRVREWQDLVGQLRQVVAELGMTLNSTPAEPDAVHRALLPGLLSHVGLRDERTRDYLGARGARFAVWPGSALAKKPPTWVMAAELVETTRLWARDVARVDPLHVEEAAAHLVSRTYSEPHWSARSGAAMAYERVTLYGVPLVTGRKVAYGRIDPEAARDLFLRHALVQGEWRTHHRFFQHNRDLVERLESLEDRARRRDILVDDDTLYAFYDARVPAEVVSVRHFDSWWKQARRHDPDLLTLSEDDLVNPDAGSVSAEDYPLVWSSGGVDLPLSYRFEPGTSDDGVTVHVPLAALHSVSPREFESQVPGLRRDLVVALLRTLPKALRKQLGPAPDAADRLLPDLAATDPDAALTDTLSLLVRRHLGVVVPPDAWDPDRLPDHLRVTFRVEDESGAVLGEGKDLARLRDALAPRTEALLSRVGADLERTGLTGWPDLARIPTEVVRAVGGREVRGHPALVDEGATVAVRVLATPAEQQAMHRHGVRRLLVLANPGATAALQRGLDTRQKLTLARNPDGSVAGLLTDATEAVVDELVDRHGGPPWTAREYDALAERVRAELPDALLGTLVEVEPVLAAWWDAQSRLEELRAPSLQPAADDVRAQLADLLRPGFVRDHGRARLPDLRRYLQAVVRRLDRLPDNPGRDLLHMEQVDQARRAYEETVATLPLARREDDDVRRLRWALEELRVSLFAPELRTAFPVSVTRITRALSRLADGPPGDGNDPG